MFDQISRFFATVDDTVLAIVLSVFISGIFMWIGANLAGAVRSTLARSIWAAFGAMVVIWLVGSLFAAYVPVVGPVFGLLPGFVIVLFLIQIIFDTGFSRALLVWIFFILAQFAAGRLAGFLLLGGSRAFFWWGPKF